MIKTSLSDYSLPYMYVHHVVCLPSDIVVDVFNVQATPDDVTESHREQLINWSLDHGFELIEVAEDRVMEGLSCLTIVQYRSYPLTCLSRLFVKR